MTVWLVMDSGWEGSYLVSVWSTEALAENEADRLNRRRSESSSWWKQVKRSEARSCKDFYVADYLVDEVPSSSPY